VSRYQISVWHTYLNLYITIRFFGFYLFTPINETSSFFYPFFFIFFPYFYNVKICLFL